MEPEITVPALVQHLVATNFSMHYRGTTINALARFGEQAKAAVPYIVPFLTDADEDIRSEATNALNAIDVTIAGRMSIK
jgi:HEAT repeat protein